MTPEDFQKLALAMPQAEASSHFGQADARVKGKIFASRLNDAGGVATLNLLPEQQQILCEAEPEAFHPVAGSWGARGWTSVHIRHLDEATARSAIAMAWRKVAPAGLVKQHPG